MIGRGALRFLRTLRSGDSCGFSMGSYAHVDGAGHGIVLATLLDIRLGIMTWP